ncbi:hypothetical protein DFH28DRAFT_891557 [Melampsora americana]|nr:hypothetical protein DFH28DRAFT_891557 [Melampsora americana]
MISSSTSSPTRLPSNHFNTLDHNESSNQLQPPPPPQPQEPTPADLPVHITLLYLTHLHLSTAAKLSKNLFIRPTHSQQLFGKPPIITSTDSLQSDLIQYRTHILIAINCLRSIVYDSTDSLQIPIQFKFNSLLSLIRVLFQETQSSKDELHQLIQLGFLLTKKNSLELHQDSKFELIELEILISIQDPNVSLRQIKKQIERAIELTINKNGTIQSKSIKWYYRFQLLFIQTNSSKDYSSSQQTIQTVLNTSLQRADQEIHLLFKAIEIKLALDHSLFALVGELIDSIIKLIGFKIDSLPTLKVSKPLEVFYLILICLYHYEMGEIEVGRQWVSYLHRTMDGLELDNGSFKVFIDSSNLPVQSTVQIDSPFTRKFEQISMFDHDFSHNPPSNHTKDSICIKLMPIELIQALVSLISASIHFDGYGKRPKGLTYLNEGIQKIDGLLMNGFKIRFPEMQNCIQRLVRMKIEGMLMMSQMSIIRSNFLLADQVLLDLIRVTTLTQQWNQYASRICFFKAMLSQSTLNFKSAKESLLASLSLLGSHSMHMRKEIKVLIKASYVMLEIDQAKDSNRIKEWLEELKSFEGSKRVEIALQIVLALKCGEIVRAKLVFNFFNLTREHD